MRLFPEDADVRALGIESTFSPRLTVEARNERGESLSGRVSYRRIDQISGLTGARVELGVLPLQAKDVPPGYLRIVVEIDGGGFREFTRWLRRGVKDYRINAQVRAEHADLTAGMVRIEAADLRIPDRPECRCSNREKTIHVPAFWIDVAEVSNGEYRRFVEATNHPPPLGWRYIDDHARYADLPVVYVSWEDARAYAEWAGKRLVSHPEWDLAGRGTGAWLFPWTDEVAPEYRGNTLAPYEPAEGEAKDTPRYLHWAAPVRSHDDARTPSGLFHMLGNVTEWTESVLAEEIDGRWHIDPLSRFVLGSAWFAKARLGATLDRHEKGDLTRKNASHYRGFRCARSDSP